MSKKPLTEKQQRLMAKVYSAPSDGTTYLDIGRNGAVKTITEVHNLVKRGLVEVVERGEAWVTVRATGPAPTIPCPAFAKEWSVYNVAHHLPALTCTHTQQILLEHVGPEQDAPKLAEIWVELPQTVQVHILEAWKRMHGSDGL